MLHRRLTLLVLLLISAPAFAQLRWQAGSDYIVLPKAERAGAPADKIEVAEVFSYGCPYCYRARADVAMLAAALPADATMVYVHASFLPQEDWPMFQRAYYTALKLGIAASTHEEMFDAIWKTHEIKLEDPVTGRLHDPLPTIEDAAKFYARVSKVKAAEFLKVAKSPAIDAAMRHADELVKLWRVPGTPQLVVDGHYLVSNDLPFEEQAQIVQFLVRRERAVRDAAPK
jgi:thiol:disulfide interchange protein DsbA